MILEHLMKIKREKNLNDEQMKFPTADKMQETRGTHSSFHCL